MSQFLAAHQTWQTGPHLQLRRPRQDSAVTLLFKTFPFLNQNRTKIRTVEIERSSVLRENLPENVICSSWVGGTCPWVNINIKHHIAFWIGLMLPHLSEHVCLFAFRQNFFFPRLQTDSKLNWSRHDQCWSKTLLFFFFFSPLTVSKNKIVGNETAGRCPHIRPLLQAPSEYSFYQRHSHQCNLLAGRLKGNLPQLSSGVNACDKNRPWSQAKIAPEGFLCCCILTKRKKGHN